MSEQILMVVTPDDDFVGYAPRGECHQGRGRLHRALAGVIFNDRGQVLLQKRKSRLWDGYWDITAATHPLHATFRDETYDEAMQRCLRAEWGVTVPMQFVLAFVYFEAFGPECENEYCVLMAGHYSGAVFPHPDHAYGMEWVDFDACLADVERHPGKYTPWARVALPRLVGHP